MPKMTVTITPDAKTQAQLDAMSETIAEMAADVNNNAALVVERGEVIDDLRRQIDRKDSIIEQWKREELDNAALRNELDATSAMLSAAERDLQATQRDLDEANATIIDLREDVSSLTESNAEADATIGTLRAQLADRMLIR